MLSELNPVTAILLPILVNHLFFFFLIVCFFFFIIQEEKYIISHRLLICFISFHFYKFSKHEHVHAAHYFQKLETDKPMSCTIKYESKIISCMFGCFFFVFS